MDNKLQLIFEAADKTQAGINSLQQSLNGLKNSIAGISAQLAIVEYTTRKAFDYMASTIKPAYEAVEKFNMSVTKMAAMITSFQGREGDISQNYLKAKEYASALVEKLEEIDAKTVASAEDLSVMTDEMAKQRVLLDINNEKAVEGFTNIANAVAVIAQGYGAKEIQIRQEIRALFQGQINMYSQLAQQLDAMVGGSLKEEIQLHKKRGDLLEWLGGLLEGYAAASGDIEGTWASIGSTMTTIKDKILRDGFTPLYKEINALLLQGLQFIKEHQGQISGVLYRAWFAIKGIIETCFNIISSLKGPLSIVGELVGMAAHGLGLIAYTILPPLSERIGFIIKGMLEWLYIIGNVAEAFKKFVTLDFEGAAKSWGKAKEHFRQSGVYAGQAFAGGFGEEIAKRYEAYTKDLTKKKKFIETPALPPGPPGDKEDKEAVEKAEREAMERRIDLWQWASEEIEKIEKELTLSQASELEKRLTKEDEWVEERTDRLFELYTAGALSEKEYQNLTAQIEEEGERRKAEIRQKFVDEETEGRLKLFKEMLEVEEEYHEKMFDVTATDLQKRLKEWDNWYDEVIEILDKLELKDEEYNERSIQAWEIAQKRKAEIVAEHSMSGSEKAVRAFEKAFFDLEGLTSRTLDSMASFIEDTLAGRAVDGFKNFCSTVKGLLSRLLSELMTLAIANPIKIIVEMVQGAAGKIYGQMTPATSGLGLAGLGKAGLYGGLGYGVGSLFGGGGGGYGALGGLAGATLLTGAFTSGYGLIGAGLTSGLFGAGITSGAVLGSVVPIIGTIGGALLGAWLGKLFGGKETPPRTQLGYTTETGFTVRHGDVLGAETTASIISVFENVQDYLKEFVEAIGGDLSVFEDQWKSWRVEIKKGMDLEAVVNEWLAAYTELATGVDFKQFQQTGEEIADTINAIVTSVLTVISMKDVDVRKIYNDIKLDANTYKEALKAIDEQLKESFNKLKDLSGTEYRAALEEIASLSASWYQSMVDCLTYIKGLQDSVIEDIVGLKESMTLETYTREQKIDFYNKRLNELFGEILATTDPTKIQELYSQIKQYFTAGWALMTEEEKKKYLQPAMEWLTDLEKTIGINLDMAVGEVADAADILKLKIEEIDWSPLYALAEAAGAAAESLSALSQSTGIPAATSYQIGTDYVPRTGLYQLHQGEAVLTAGETRTITGLLSELLKTLKEKEMTVNNNIYGDLGSVIRVAADMGANKAIRQLKRYPRLSG